jgi:acetolactate synthase-1/2/3 large subunit
MHLWEAVVHMVKAQGVELVFGIGDTDFHLFAEKTEGIRPVNLRYEGSAPFMAMAYSRLTGKPGVCSASSGPGIASMVPGVLEAWSACTPLLVLSPTVSQVTEGMGDFQECDQTALLKPITKWSARVTRADRVSWFIRRAFSIAMNGQPGPVFLEVPYDVGGSLSQLLGAVEVGSPPYAPVQMIRTAGDAGLIAAAAELLLSCQRPVVIAGGGVVASAASAELAELVELLGLPFLTTPAGRGILSEDHPLAAGQPGLYRTRVGKELLAGADLLITVGSRNEGFQTHAWNDFPRGARYIQIDVSPFEIGRNWVPDVGILGDAKTVLGQLTAAVREKVGGKLEARKAAMLKEMASAKQALEREVDVECGTDDRPIPAKRIVHEVSGVFGEDTILASENGSQDTWSYCYPYYKVAKGSLCVPVAEQTCMGMGVVGAIAARLTRPDKKVVCITGDGAFQMYMKELPTASQYRAGCTWIVLNNRSFGWIESDENNAVGWNTARFGVQPDFVKWAEACDCFGRRVEEAGQLRPALEEALRKNREGIPAVLDVVTGLDLEHFHRSE